MNGYNIAILLKQLRKTSGRSANDIVEQLKTYDINISAKTLYGYESGLSMPNANVFVALCCIYKCDNPLDMFGSPTFNQNEIAIITKYRDLDPHGKEMVDMVLDKEHERCEKCSEFYEIAAKSQHSDKVAEFPAPYTAAAHERTDIDVTEDMRKHDDDIMMDDSEWE